MACGAILESAQRMGDHKTRCRNTSFLIPSRCALFDVMLKLETGPQLAASRLRACIIMPIQTCCANDPAVRNGIQQAGKSTHHEVNKRARSSTLALGVGSRDLWYDISTHPQCDALPALLIPDALQNCPRLHTSRLCLQFRQHVGNEAIPQPF